jgi:hypothetical protein
MSYTEGLASLAEKPVKAAREIKPRRCKWCGQKFLPIKPHRQAATRATYCDDPACENQRRLDRRRRSPCYGKQYERKEEKPERYGKRRSLLSWADEKAFREHST